MATVLGTLQGSSANVTSPLTTTSGSIAVSVGDLIVVVYGRERFADNTAVATGCTDDLGHTYTAGVAGTSTDHYGILYWKRVSTAGTLHTVSVTTNFTGSGENANIAVIVFAGSVLASPLDKNPACNTDITSPFTCPSTTTLTQANEIVIGWAVQFLNSAILATAPNTLGVQVTTQTPTVVIGYQEVAATTAVAPAFTGTNPAQGICGTASFMLSAASISGSMAPQEVTFDTPSISGSIAGAAANPTSIPGGGPSSRNAIDAEFAYYRELRMKRREQREGVAKIEREQAAARAAAEAASEKVRAEKARIDAHAAATRAALAALAQKAKIDRARAERGESRYSGIRGSSIFSKAPGTRH